MAYNDRSRYGTDYGSNPFSGLAQMPYVSMKQELPLNDYISTLDKIENRRQQSLATEDLLSLAMSNIEATGQNAQNRLDSIIGRVREQLDVLSGGEFGYADPNANDKLRKLARQTAANEDLRHIDSFTKAYKEDLKLRQKLSKEHGSSNYIDIGKPTTDAFDENEEQVDYVGNWEKKGDWNKTQTGIWKDILKEISSEYGQPQQFDSLGRFLEFAKTKGISKDQVDEKLDAAFNNYMGNTVDGQQQLKYYSNQLMESDPNINRSEAESIITDVLKREFNNTGYLMTYQDDAFKILGNPGYSTTKETDQAVDDAYYNTVGHKTPIYEDGVDQIMEIPVTSKEVTPQVIMKQAMYANFIGNKENLGEFNVLKNSLETLKMGVTSEELQIALATGNMEAIKAKIENTMEEHASKEGFGGGYPNSEELKSRMDLYNDVLNKANDFENKQKQFYSDVNSYFEKDYENVVVRDVSEDIKKSIKAVADQVTLVPDEHGDKKGSDFKIVNVRGSKRTGTNYGFEIEDQDGKIRTITIDDVYLNDKTLSQLNKTNYAIAAKWKGAEVYGGQGYFINGTWKELPDGYNFKTVFKEENGNKVPYIELHQTKDEEDSIIKITTLDDKNNRNKPATSIPMEDAFMFLELLNSKGVI